MGKVGVITNHQVAELNNNFFDAIFGDQVGLVYYV